MSTVAKVEAALLAGNVKLAAIALENLENNLCESDMSAGQIVAIVEPLEARLNALKPSRKVVSTGAQIGREMTRNGGDWHAAKDVVFRQAWQGRVGKDSK